MIYIYVILPFKINIWIYTIVRIYFSFANVNNKAYNNHIPWTLLK